MGVDAADVAVEKLERPVSPLRRCDEVPSEGRQTPQPVLGDATLWKSLSDTAFMVATPPRYTVTTPPRTGSTSTGGFRDSGTDDEVNRVDDLAEEEYIEQGPPAFWCSSNSLSSTKM